MLSITNINNNNYYTNFKSNSKINSVLKNAAVNAEMAKTIVKASRDGYSFLGATPKSTRITKEETFLNQLCDRIMELRFRSNNGRKKVYNLYFRNIPEPLKEAISTLSKPA